MLLSGVDIGSSSCVMVAPCRELPGAGELEESMSGMTRPCAMNSVVGVILSRSCAASAFT